MSWWKDASTTLDEDAACNWWYPMNGPSPDTPIAMTIPVPGKRVLPSLVLLLLLLLWPTPQVLIAKRLYIFHARSADASGVVFLAHIRLCSSA